VIYEQDERIQELEADSGNYTWVSNNAIGHRALFLPTSLKYENVTHGRFYREPPECFMGGINVKDLNGSCWRNEDGRIEGNMSGRFNTENLTPTVISSSEPQWVLKMGNKTFAIVSREHLPNSSHWIIYNSTEELK